MHLFFVSLLRRPIREYKGVVTGEVITGANGSMLMVATSGTAVVI